jgi:hypothetical protein
MASNELFLTLAVAFIVAAAIGGWVFLSGSMDENITSRPRATEWTDIYAEPQPVLKPAELQDFQLTEKTIISHNVAMYVLPHLVHEKYSAN